MGFRRVLDRTPRRSRFIVQLKSRFFLADLDAALTFMDIAETRADEEMRRRNCQNAWYGHNTVSRLMQNVTLNDA
jgi:hypothetical protein